MLQVVMGLEQSVACEELDKNAPYAPDVAWKAPAQLQDDLGRPIVSRRDY